MQVKGLKAEAFETLLDRFSPKAEAPAGMVLVHAGTPLDSLIVIITGTVELLSPDGQVRNLFLFTYYMSCFSAFRYA